MEMKRAKGNYTKVFLIGIIFVALSSAAKGAIYKCANSAGEIEYSQSPCKEGSKAKQVKVYSGNKKAVIEACPQIGQFVGKVAGVMKRKVSSINVIAEYGGIDNIPKSALSIINYVYRFEQSKKTNIYRIKALALNNCNNGAFGDVRYEDIPGAEDPESLEYLHKKRLEGMLNRKGINRLPQYNSPAYSRPKKHSYKQTVGAKPSRLCSKFKKDLKIIDAQMLSGYRINQSERLSSQRRKMVENIRQECR